MAKKQRDCHERRMTFAHLRLFSITRTNRKLSLFVYLRLDERAYIEAMNIRNKKETQSMLVETIHTWGEELRRKKWER